MKVLPNEDGGPGLLSIEVGNQCFPQGASSPSLCQVQYDQEMPSWPSTLLLLLLMHPGLLNRKWVSIISAVFVRLTFFFSFPALS